MLYLLHKGLILVMDVQGQWRLCYKLVHGVWAEIHGEVLTLVAKPTFGPLVGIAGSRTRLTFSGTAVRDAIVFTTNDCSLAHTYSPGPATLPIRLQSSEISTTENMTMVDKLRVCFAVQESGMDSPDDWATLDLSLIQRAPPVAHPVRVVVGSTPDMTLTNIIEGTLFFRYLFHCRHATSFECRYSVFSKGYTLLFSPRL